MRGHDSGTVVGWVLDSPELIIHRSVALHFDPNQGWSTLFPTEWTLSNSGAQTTFTGSGQLMSVVLGNDTSNLPNTPLSAGKEVRQESPVEIYGKTTYITVYQLSAGGFEYDSSAKFSATKSLTAVCVLMLAERGRLDLDAPIAKMWPEFAQGDKAACTPRHVLTHQGGFPVFPRDFPGRREFHPWAQTAGEDAIPQRIAEPAISGNAHVTLRQSHANPEGFPGHYKWSNEHTLNGPS